MRFTGVLEGAMRFSFSTSLRDMGRAAAESEARKLAEAGLGLAGGGSGFNKGGRSNPFDVWVDAKYASFNDNRGQADLSGHFGIISIGADYVLGPNLLVGTLVQFDSMQQRSDSVGTDIRGTGWMAGPYATLRLSQNVFWQMRGAWGRSSNEVSPFLSYIDSFDSTRWLAASTLSGRWQHGPWSIRPSASVSYMEDVSESYADTFGLDIPSVKSRLGQAKLGPEIGYRIDLGRTVIEPHAGVQLIYNFANETTAAGMGGLGEDAAGPDGVRGRAAVGVRAKTSDGFSLDVSGSYDGIGASNYNAVTGRVMVRVPLN
jgi:outer membrane autotransporter protein